MPKGVPNKRYTPEFKRMVVETMEKEHLSIYATMQEFGINDHKIIERWERIYLEEGPEGLAIERRGRGSKDRPPKQLPKQVEEDLLAEVQRLASRPDYEQAFYFFHELRHAAQYLRPESFPASIRRSLSYILQYDGTCYKWINGRCLKCSFADSAAEFPDLYLGQPYERDANEFAYHRVLDILGFSEGLQRLYRFWMPSRPVPEGRYDAVYAAIDEKLGF